MIKVLAEFCQQFDASVFDHDNYMWACFSSAGFSLGL